MDDAFGDDRTEAVQWYANTYGGVHADNTFENCNEEKDGALSAAGECYHGAGPNMFLEFLNNTMVNSGGITVANRAQVKYTDAVCNATVHVGLTKRQGIRWCFTLPYKRLDQIVEGLLRFLGGSRLRRRSSIRDYCGTVYVQYNSYGR